MTSTASVHLDPAWTVELPTDPRLERVAESLGALSNGYVGTRASWEEPGPGATPLVVVQGVYAGRDDPQRIHGPIWTTVDVARATEPARRLLDLRGGVLVRLGTGDDPPSLRFVSAHRPHAMAMRFEIGSEHAAAAGTRSEIADGGDDGRRITEATSGCHDEIVVRTSERVTRHGARVTVERIACCVGGTGPEDRRGEATERLAELDAIGFDRLLAEHRTAWARRWESATVSIAGDPEMERACRFAVFHLLAAARGNGEMGVGARGLTGRAYGGHVFWDADVFVLPVLAALDPPAARAMLEYRIRRLPAARRAAARSGRRGARFPWESADTGDDVTPRSGVNAHGRRVPILTGEREEHITADVAWSVCEYVAWTGDHEVLTGEGRALVMDTARYWSSRCEMDADGRAHIRGVIGPDEYHELVDDNAFTNVMARWNLRRAAAGATLGDATAAEVGNWLRLADALVDGHDAATGRYEQFAGYWDLEPLMAADVHDAEMFAADVLLGVERTRAAQVIKQADVLMLHHLVPDEVASGSLEANLDHYLPRTSHGSSLSPAVHAALLARANRADEALTLFRTAARLDLDDRTGSTAGGLHLATMGGTWQALSSGFLGLRALHDGLHLDPHLPRPWRTLTLSCWYHGQILTIRATHHDVAITCEHEFTAFVRGVAGRCVPGRTTFQIGDHP